MVQACVRGWLARRNYLRLKAQMAISVLTLQRHVRGWLTRKRLKERQKQLAREFQKGQQEQENQRKQRNAGKFSNIKHGLILIRKFHPFARLVFVQQVFQIIIKVCWPKY